MANPPVVRRLERRLLLPAVGLAVVLFLSIYAIAANVGAGVRLDLTEQRLYTLSDGTRALLTGLQEPVRLRLYQSAALTEVAPQIGAYADRVRELLRTYVSLSEGRIRLDIIDPEPFSPEEDRAVGFGLRGAAAGASGDRVFFGIAGTNTTGDQEVIAFLSPEREPFLEYDLTRMIYALAEPGKPVVALIDGLALAGGPANRFEPQQVLVQMRQFFEVRTLGGDISAIDPDVRVLVLVHPQGLSDTTLYAIDQYVLGGGRALIFLDPRAETQQGLRPGQPPPDPSSTLERLMTAWGVAFSADSVIGDRANAMPVQVQVGNRPVSTSFLPWMDLGRTQLASNDPVTAQLENLTLTSAGSFTLREGATATLTPLAQTSPDAAPIPVERITVAATDPRTLARDFTPTGTSYSMIARLSGTIATAFPDGRPASAAGPQTGDSATAGTEHRTRSTAPANIILVGDADMLSDRNWLSVRQAFGERVGVPFAANADFAVNAIDNLAGGAALLELRGRGLIQRPFGMVRDIEAAAEARFRQTEQELLQRLEATERRMEQIGRGERGGDRRTILTAAEQQEIERFRTELLEIRSQLREVQLNLRRDVTSLQRSVIVLNVVAVPALVLLLGLGWAALRSRRFRPPPSPALPTAIAPDAA